MRIAKITIILTTLALAGFVGSSDGDMLRTAACRLDGVASVLAGGSVSGTCQR
jgi:hypothetical protein